MSTTKDKTASEAAPPVGRDELHIDDFLNRTENAANRELLAAFAFVQRKRGVVKRELGEWQKDLERFMGETPK